tara:strand:+ start:765 stop:959 length:195 start_codon:yes stop_codon:yes gene_type:complete
MIDFLPEQLQELESIPLFASVIWLALIIIMIVLLLLIRPLQNFLKKSKNEKDLGKNKIKKFKGF